MDLNVFGNSIQILQRPQNKVLVSVIFVGLIPIYMVALNTFSILILSICFIVIMINLLARDMKLFAANAVEISTVAQAALAERLASPAWKTSFQLI